MMSRIDWWHWKMCTGRHFQNGHHNTAKIQHCPISSKFVMWVDKDVPNWFPTLKNFYRSPFSKWPQYRTNSTLSDFNDISYVGRLWCPELIPDIEKFLPVVIFKMATTIPHKFNIVRFQRNFICSRLWCPELIPAIKIFFTISIFIRGARMRLQNFQSTKKNGDICETFRNSILLLSYLVYLLIRSILFTTINKVEIGKLCNIMKTNTTLSEQF